MATTDVRRILTERERYDTLIRAMVKLESMTFEKLDRIEKKWDMYERDYEHMLIYIIRIEKLLKKPAIIDFSHPAVKDSELFKLLENVFEKLEEMKE